MTYTGGGTHLPEFTMFKLVFCDGDLLGIPAVIGHYVDVGGKSAVGFRRDATDIFQEGLRVPPVKLFRKGGKVEEVCKIIHTNTKAPKLVYGDLRAMCSALLTGERRFLEIAKK